MVLHGSSVGPPTSGGTSAHGPRCPGLSGPRTRRLRGASREFPGRRVRGPLHRSGPSIAQRRLVARGVGHQVGVRRRRTPRSSSRAARVTAVGGVEPLRAARTPASAATGVGAQVERSAPVEQVAARPVRRRRPARSRRRAPGAADRGGLGARARRTRRPPRARPRASSGALEGRHGSRRPSRAAPRAAGRRPRTCEASSRASAPLSGRHGPVGQPALGSRSRLAHPEQRLRAGRRTPRRGRRRRRWLGVEGLAVGAVQVAQARIGAAQRRDWRPTPAPSSASAASSASTSSTQRGVGVASGAARRGRLPGPGPVGAGRSSGRPGRDGHRGERRQRRRRAPYDGWSRRDAGRRGGHGADPIAGTGDRRVGRPGGSAPVSEPGQPLSWTTRQQHKEVATREQCQPGRHPGPDRGGARRPPACPGPRRRGRRDHPRRQAPGPAHRRRQGRRRDARRRRRRDPRGLPRARRLRRDGRAALHARGHLARASTGRSPCRATGAATPTAWSRSPSTTAAPSPAGSTDPTRTP